MSRLVRWCGITRSRYYDWKERRGLPNYHNSTIPRKHWLLSWEKQAIIDYAGQHPGEGYRRLSYMMLDADIVAVSPSSVYRVLKAAGIMRVRGFKASKKGSGFDQPLEPHDHWHTDFAYLKLAGTFYFLVSVLDGCSRAILSWNIGETMSEADAEIVLQQAREQYPKAKPRIISDNGPQFVAKEFKEFVRLCEMTHVRTSPYYPQSNGKIERWHRNLKEECVRPTSPQSQEDANRVVGDFVHAYNSERLHGAIGYITPYDRLAGHHKAIFAERKVKLATARKNRMAEFAKMGELAQAA